MKTAAYFLGLPSDLPCNRCQINGKSSDSKYFISTGRRDTAQPNARAKSPLILFLSASLQASGKLYNLLHGIPEPKQYDEQHHEQGEYGPATR
jgi:hypothetical protein